jgi:dTDP-4-amino-4,6-dideoxygalactose transaminase
VCERHSCLESMNPNPIRLSKSCIGEAEKSAVMAVLDREYLGMGTEVMQFEHSLTEFLGRTAVCVANGTAALHLALQACGIGDGDEVLVQSLTYIASFQAISATGAKPIPCDIDQDTLTLNWRDAEKRITRNTKAVMPVHYGGGVGALDEIYAFAKKYGLRVIEDAAHAFGTFYQGKRIGGQGDIVCFSFDGIKNITSGEGGCIVTNDFDVLQRVKDARLLGVEKDTDKRYSGQRSWLFDVKTQGWRYHMSNIMAAIGIEQLKRFSEMAEKRQKLAKRYDFLLQNNPMLKLFDHDYDKVVPHIYVVQIKGDRRRELICDRLGGHGIQTGVHYQPNHFLSLYRRESAEDLSVTSTVFPRLISLPLHVDLELEEVDFICEKLIRSL